MIESLVPIILVDVEENSGLSYDKVLFELTEEQKRLGIKNWYAGTNSLLGHFFKNRLPRLAI